jgi:hypothetical protein
MSPTTTVAPAPGQAVEVGQVLQPVAVGAGEDQVGVEARRVPRVDAEGVDAEAADPPPAQEPLGGLGAEAGEVQGAGHVGAAVGIGVADLGRQRLQRGPICGLIDRCVRSDGS